MKRLDELGVSPAPWRAEGDCVYHAKGGYVLIDADPIADARLVAAAPDLYEALRDCVTAMCEYCRREAAHTMPGVPCDNGCAVMLAAKKALEKAGGAE